MAALVIDPDGVYDPRLGNDRLLLGVKGTMSEYELGLLRQRAQAALQAKAARGELQFGLPVGLVWTPSGTIELTPDTRIREALAHVFQKFDEVGSVRQLLLWFRQEEVTLPALTGRREVRTVVWKLPVYRTLYALVTNPIYAGAYVFGRHERRTRLVDGRPQITDGHRKPQERWTVLLRDHHPGYVTWDAFTRNQQRLAENAHMKQLMARKAARGGRALLAGLLRCARCGRMLHVVYGGLSYVARYYCRGAHVDESRPPLHFIRQPPPGCCDRVRGPAGRPACGARGRVRGRPAGRADRHRPATRATWSWNRPATRRTSQGVGTRPSTLLNGWSPPNWNGAGMAHSRTSRTWNRMRWSPRRRRRSPCPTSRP